MKDADTVLIRGYTERAGCAGYRPTNAWLGRHG